MYFRELGVKTESYGYLLSEMMISGIGTVNGSFSSSSTSDSEDVNPFEKYDPKYLDDPELRTGRHCTMVALAGYYASLSHYVPAEQLKEELNCQFRLKHVHHIHPSMTLTKIRSLKGLLIDVALECDLELASVALAFVYLEKLILARLVERGNRKVASGCCLLLAVKAHDLKDVDYGKLMAVLGKQLGVSIVSLVRMEFPVFAGLRFDLHLPQSEYLPHLERILVDLPFSNLQEYLGERMYQHWKKTPKNINNI